MAGPPSPDMSNDPVPCVECNCVLVVKDVTDEFALVGSELQPSSSFARGTRGASRHPGGSHKLRLKTGLSTLLLICLELALCCVSLVWVDI